MKRLMLALSASLSACSPHALMALPVEPIAVESSAEGPPLGMLSAFRETQEIAMWICPTCSGVKFSPGNDVKTWATATWLHGGSIRYNPKQMFEVYRHEGRDAVVGIIAHEWGHVVLRTSSQAMADAWAGCTLRLLGADVKPFTAFLERVHSTYDAQDRIDLRMRVYATGGAYDRCETPGDMLRAFAEHLPTGASSASSVR